MGKKDYFVISLPHDCLARHRKANCYCLIDKEISVFLQMSRVERRRPGSTKMSVGTK